MSVSSAKLKELEDAASRQEEPRSQNHAKTAFGKNGADVHHRADTSGGNSGDPMDAYLQVIPQSGGPFGGRNETCYSLCGLLWRKRFSLKGAQTFVEGWNLKFCQPPMDYSEWYRLVGEAYADANAKNWKQDETEREFGENVEAKLPKLEILTVAELLAIADDPAQQLKWVAEDLIQEDGITLFSGPSGHGKTWLALDFCRHLTRHEDEYTGKWLGRFELGRRRVLYMDEENGQRTMGSRVRKLGFDALNESFFSWSYSQFKLLDPKGRKFLIQTAKDRGINLIVFDSLIAIHQKDENSSTEMRRVGEALTEFVTNGFTVVALHHDTKGKVGGDGETQEQDKTRGSGDIVAFSQTVLGITRRGKIHTVTRRKVRNAEVDDEVFQFMLSPDPERDGGVVLDVEGAKEKSEEDKQRRHEEAMQRHTQRVEEAIAILTEQGKPLTSRNIAETAGMSQRIVAEVRKQMNAASDRYDLRDDD